MRRVIPVGLGLVLLIAVSGFTTNPSDDVQKEEKKVQGWLGVSIRDITAKMAKQENLKSRDGAYLLEVLEDSPAEEAGLEKGDVIVEFGGKSVGDADELSEAVRELSPGTKTSVVVQRKGEKKTFQVTIGKIPKSHAFAFSLPRIKSPVMRMFGRGHSLGLRLLELSPQLGEYFGAPEGEGVLVENVEPKSAGEKAGFKAGDIILKVGKRSINDVGDVMRALESYEGDSKVDAEVLRRGARKTLSVEIENSENDADESAWFHTFPHGERLHRFGIEMPELDIDLPTRPHIRIEKELRDLEGLDRFHSLPNFPNYRGFPKSI